MVEIENKIQRYDKYKDSGVEWLGDKIPEHWKALANKFIFNLKKNQVGKKSADYDLLSLTLKGIVIRNLENGGKFPAEFDTYQEVKKGDFVFCLFDVEETPRCVGLSDYNGMITGAYTVMEPNENFDRSFLYYFYLNLDADKRMKPLYTGLRNTISKDNFFAFKTFVPPLNEQTAIAQFLDDKTTKIDEAITIKKQQISLLKERKQILIHKAVTEGLDPNVTLKDSGVEWIGDIPEHWMVKKLKYATRIFRGKFTHRPRNDERMYDGEYPFFQTGDVARAGKYLSIYKQTLNEKGLRVSTLFPKGTIVITIAANIGDISILDIDACFPDSIVGFEPNNFVEKHFLYNSLLVMKEQFMSSTIKNTQMNLNVDRIGSNSIVIPSIEEQEEISKYIEIASQKIETAINLKQQEIAKLKEYKSSLINSVVTGKVRVTTN